MTVTLSLTSSQTTASIREIPNLFRSYLLYDAKITVPQTTNSISLAFGILNRDGKPVYVTTGIYPNVLNYIRPEVIIDNGYQVWIKPGSAPGNNINVTVELGLATYPHSE